MFKNQKGLTLVELLVTLSLTGLVVMLAVQIYITQSSNFKLSQEQAKLISEAQYIQEQLTAVGVQSEGISELWSENLELTNEISTNQDITSLSFITLDKRDLAFNYDKDSHQFSYSGSVLSNNVTAFNVKIIGGKNKTTYAQAKSIEVELTLTSSNLRHPVDHTTTVSITFRNK